MKLLVNALLKFISGLAAVGLLLFLPAGTLHFWNAWLFSALLFLPMLIVGVLLFVKAPELLEKRLNTREQEGTQKAVVALSALIFCAAFLLAGLDFRFGWSHMPLWLIAAAAVLQLVSYGLYAEVMRENAYLSRTVEIQENQKVIDTGLYGIVRHPMYLAVTLLFLAIPLVLGSWPSFVLSLCNPLLLVLRIRNEEQVLEQGLPGYVEYKQRVRWRMIPFLW
ncbi:MAG: methyltransferase family protein [Candidatus Onthomonas sp.]